MNSTHSIEKRRINKNVCHQIRRTQEESPHQQLHKYLEKR